MTVQEITYHQKNGTTFKIFYPHELCGPCSVWLQTGQDDHLACQHASSAMRHPGGNAEATSAYVSCQQYYDINLQPDSCICHGCEMDFLRNKNNKVTPRWLRMRNEVYTTKHYVWAGLLKIINAYIGLYFAIRSGNFMLRNSCIKDIASLFYAYSRDKYEELTLTNLQDYLTFPQELLDQLMSGEWTVSCKGNPYHNLAIDESHECFINRRLKQNNLSSITFQDSTVGGLHGIFGCGIAWSRKLCP